MKEAVRKFILSRARDVFQANGFAGATVDEIAAAAEVSKPTLYNYFKGKNAIFMAVLKDLHNEVAAEIRPYVTDSPQGFNSRMRRMALQIAKSFFSQQGLARIMLSERRRILEVFSREEGLDDEEFKRFFMHGEIFKVLSEFFAAARVAGEFTSDAKPDILAAMYIGMMGQINMYQVLHEWREEEYMSAVETAVDVFCHGLVRCDVGESQGVDAGKGC